MLDRDGEDQLAFRDGRRHVARLVRISPASTAPIPLKADASYLITGGLGALGLHVARWMVEHGAKHLVLLGRNGLPERRLRADLPADERGTRRRVAAVQSLESLGATVDIVQADVTDFAQMSAVFERLQAGHAPLRGLIHAAGVEGFQVLGGLQADAFQSVLHPKLAGAWNLHQLSRDLSLDFFVCYSSIASVWGSIGQAHYAAANQFLDALAHHRRAAGLPALSVNWGPWTGGGMATPEAQAVLARLGVAALQAGEATEALGRLLAAGATQATVAKVDWDVFKPIYEARRARPLLERIGVDPAKAARVSANGHPDGSRKDEYIEVRGRLERAPASQRQELLAAQLQKEVARVLGLDPARLPDRELGFFELGMDSLMAVQLKSSLEEGLGCTLPRTLAFEQPNIDSLAAYLLKEVLDLEDSRGTEVPSGDGILGRPMTLTDLEHLPEDQLIALIAQELESSEL
jgi:NAD(P)-dependent dehydrogenase (short-subunit alcohol dehydrogenase family)/acyl carrier protein